MVNDDVEGRRSGVTYMYDGQWGHAAHVHNAISKGDPLGFPGNPVKKEDFYKRR